MARLTDASVKAAKAGPTVRDVYDGGEAGLCLRVHPSGRKAWGLRIRIAGKQRRFDLGEYPSTSLADARGLAAAMKKAASRGEDPSRVLRPAPSNVPTVSDALAVYMETKTDNRSHGLEQRRFAIHVEPVIGAKSVEKVSKADLDELLHAMVKAGMRAEPNRVFTSLKGFFSWAVYQRGYRADNPTAGMKRPVKIEPSQARQKAGTVAVIELDELADLWRLAPSVPSAVLPALVRCLIAVPLRRQEWTALRWSEVRQIVEDGWRGWALKLPAERMKGRRAAVVPLPTQAVAIIEDQRRITGGSDFVFSVPGRNAPFAGWKRGADTLRKALGSPTEWTPHDIRRSVATALARDVGADEGIIKRILQHSDDSLLGVTAIYQKSRRLKEQAAALQSWCDLVEKVAAGAAEGDVVTMEPRRVG
ncbi:MAG TPA: integrase arm-type DNA-binding domain-containing protein [Stellaceae bacterium]|jgi:integrase